MADLARRLVPARRSPYDREIWRLALPAFGALAAEPLYVLVDTAIVGQLGTRQLAGLAVAGTVLTAAFAVFNFLAYSTTAAVARQVGAGNRRAAAALGVDGVWLAGALGLALAIAGIAASSVIVDAMGASAGVRPYALEYLRISMVGAPFMLLMLAGAGYLRGLQDTRTTLVIAVAANVVNLALEVLFVYGFDWGVAGSAWGTVVAQIGAGVAYVDDRGAVGAGRAGAAPADAAGSAPDRRGRRAAHRPHGIVARRVPRDDGPRRAHLGRRRRRASDRVPGVHPARALPRRPRDRGASDDRALPGRRRPGSGAGGGATDDRVGCRRRRRLRRRARARAAVARAASSPTTPACKTSPSSCC